MDKIKTVVIEGPTASGKTALSVEIAKRFDGEIVCADSMQIYKKMSIATAKPTVEEMQGVRHHLVDFLEPGEEFSVADYTELAHKAVSEINSRGRLPIICGGTGLYIDSLLQNIRFSETETDHKLRDELSGIAEKKGGKYLLNILSEFDPESAEKLHENNIKRIIRAIEVYKTSGITMSEQIKSSKNDASPYDALKICLEYRDRDVLYKRIDMRVDKMLESGLLKEAEEILKDTSLKTSRQAIGYKELEPYFDGKLTLSECIDNLKRRTRQYAKRQMTWFRRDENTLRLYPDDYDSSDGLIMAASEVIESFLKGDRNAV